MKAFKGCVNSDCIAYKKVKFKDDDLYCPKCGQNLSYVCADCWKVMDTNEKRYCESCWALKEQKKAQMVDNVKEKGVIVFTIAGVFAKGVKELGVDADKVVKGGKKIVGLFMK